MRDRAQWLQAKAMREGEWLSDDDARSRAREQLGPEPWRHAPATRASVIPRG